VHGPAALVAYISTITTLRPGDIILTGTPGGVGHARKPPRYLEAGDVVEVGIEGIGELRNRVVKAGR
jgi:acylpyruvate hydrolase